MSKYKWHPTGFRGVRYREHPERKHGAVSLDRYFVVRFQRDGKRQEEALGWASEGWTEERAYEELAALKRAARTANGPSSLREKRAAEEERKRREAIDDARKKTLADVVEEFLTEKELRPKTVEGYKACFDLAIKYQPDRSVPPLGEWKIENVERSQLKGLIKETEKRSASLSRLLRAALSSLYTWAVQEEITDHNPVRDIKRVKIHPRSRTLNDEELGRLWRALDGQGQDRTMGRLVKFLLLTGCRLSEATGLHSREIEGHWWEVPASRHKGDRPHRVFLTEEALALLDGGGDMPLSNPRTGKPFEAASPSRFLNKSDYFGLEKFTCHDLRRTVITGLAKKQIRLEVVSAVAGHVIPGPTIKHYQQYQYDKEKKIAMQKWTHHVLDTARGGKNRKAEVVDISSGKSR